MSKSLLLISKLSEDQIFAAEAAKVAGLTLITVGTAQEGASVIVREEPTVIFVDTSSEAQYRELEKEVQDSVGLFSDKISANAIHFLAAEQLENVQYLIQSPLFGHFIHRTYQEDPVSVGQHYGRIVRATQADRAFGLANLMKENAKIQVVKIPLSSQKQSSVEAVRNYLIAAKFQTRMATLIANAVDELLMNAMFDAPVDELGKQMYKSTSRSTQLKLEGKSAVEMHLGFDGSYVAITAVDLYGSLDKNKLLAHISKIYTDEEYKVKTSVAGAGIGLATVFHSGGSFFFVSESSSRTEVTVFFKRYDSFRMFKDQFRFISTQFYF